jgi:DNA-directed RNA polymerase specialized sigma24 family protein
MSAAVLVLPRVWASVPVQMEANEEEFESTAPPPPELAFYRKYTEAMLRRYASMSMEAGRVPSLLGREMFRAKVTNYVVQSFEDVVIFVHDVEKCVAKLDKLEQILIRRIGVQQYTQAEVSAMTHLSLRTVLRQYPRALDRLTEIFLEVKLLEPRIACQEAEAGGIEVRG